MNKQNLSHRFPNVDVVCPLHHFVPVLIGVETNEGHGAGKPTSKVIREIVYFSFSLSQSKLLGI
jgi:hypothetical protein